MLAVGGDPEPPLEGAGLLYEPKYDGIRAIAEVVGGESARARLWSRNGNEKTAQFPDIVAALEAWGRALTGTLVLDGEVVALDQAGTPQGFQRLQHRIHVSVPGYRSKKAILPPDEQPAALVVFDLLVFGAHDLRDLPLSDRRAALEQLLDAHPFPSHTLRISEQVAGDGRALHARAKQQGWEGLLVKQARSPYRSGRRSPEWRKLKLQNVGEFVVCGYTNPQGARARFGALILGAGSSSRGKAGALAYVGDVGTGFNGDEIERLWGLLQRLRTDTSPLADTPPALARRAHWVQPVLVAQVRYTEMTDERRLRHPAYLGLRDDKTATEVRETAETGPARAGARTSSRDVLALAPPATTRRGSSATTRIAPASATARPGAARAATLAEPKRATNSRRAAMATLDTSETAALIDQLDVLEQSRKDGRLVLPDGDTPRGDEPSQGLLARDRTDQGRSAAALRARGAAHPAGDQGPAARHEAPAERRDGQGVLPASRAGAGAVRRPRRDAAGR